jgi:hypothetical protein
MPDLIRTFEQDVLTRLQRLALNGKVVIDMLESGVVVVEFTPTGGNADDSIVGVQPHVTNAINQVFFGAFPGQAR